MDIPPTPADVRAIKKRKVRSQTQILLDDARNFQAMDNTRSVNQDQRRLIGEQMLNRPGRVVPEKTRYKPGQLHEVDGLVTKISTRPEHYALSFEKREGEATAEWAKRMKEASKKVDTNLQKFSAQKQRLRAASAATPNHHREEIKVESAQSQKRNHKPPSGLKRANSMVDMTAEPKAARERSGSALKNYQVL